MKQLDQYGKDYTETLDMLNKLKDDIATEKAGDTNSFLRLDLDELNIKIRDLELTSFPSTLSAVEIKKRKTQLADLRSQYNLIRGSLFNAESNVLLDINIVFFNQCNRRKVRNLW